MFCGRGKVGKEGARTETMSIPNGTIEFQVAQLGLEEQVGQLRTSVIQMESRGGLCPFRLILQSGPPVPPRAVVFQVGQLGSNGIQ